MHPEIIIIVAYAAHNRAIGKNGNLPWKNISADMKRFADETKGHTVIMGRDTYWSIPEKYRPLSGRENIVVTQSQTQQDFPDGVIICTNLDEALQKAGKGKIFLIGGSGIYNEAMERNLANTLLVTIVHKTIEDADRFFPKITPDWVTLHQGLVGKDESSGIPIQFLTMTNKKKSFLPLV